MKAIDLATLIDHWTTHILDWALVLAAVATITMALLELLKAILAVRRRYHERRIRTWLGPGDTYGEMMMLAVGGGGAPQALFDQPTNKMMGQIQAAANTALDFPDRYPAFYTFLTVEPGTRAATSDQDIWREFCARVERGERIDPENTEFSADVSRATRARARLDHFVARRLDAFQTVTEYLWARGNQAVAVAGATIFLLFLLAAHRPLNVGLVVIAFFGGTISPLAKDVVAALGDLRTRR
ncbi:MAG TPA: hypothetical protein VKB93_01735 [Thermoanaerobaculia bacterium]|nr:hypothetical protein [Thermoanaerobaculia bacterium]